MQYVFISEWMDVLCTIFYSNQRSSLLFFGQFTILIFIVWFNGQQQKINETVWGANMNPYWFWVDNIKRLSTEVSAAFWRQTPQYILIKERKKTVNYCKRS